MATEEDVSMNTGNINYYAIDPFDDPFEVKRDPGWLFPDANVLNPTPDKK